MSPDATDPPANASCLGCGYSLRGLSGKLCPECGRAFDPANPKSMNLGRKAGFIVRFLLRPKRRWPIIYLAVATCLVVTSARWPIGDVRLRLIDLRYYFGSRGFRLRLLSYTDWAYAGGLILAAAVFGLCIFGVGLRAILRRIYQQPPPPPVNMGRRVVLGTFAIFAMGGSIVIGWPYRIARAWIRQIMAMPPSPSPYLRPPLPLPPLSLTTADQTLSVLRTAVMRLPSSIERMTAVKLVLQDYSTLALPILIEAVGREKDPNLRATQVRMIGLFQDSSTLAPLLSWWDDPEPEVRAAVADAIGVLHGPAYPLPLPNSGTSAQSAYTNTDPQIGFRSPMGASGTPEAIFEGPNPERQYPLGFGDRMDYVRPKVIQRLIGGATTLEREAAARAVLGWQKNYKLRVAEWGVWINVHGELKFLQSIIEEIPPFVHRTGDALATLNDRIAYTNMFVTKPILHLTTDQLMVVDLQVLITRGRPWFAYPEPDDFTLSVVAIRGRFDARAEPEPPAMQRFDSHAIAPLDSPREGYPWLDPRHRLLTPNGWSLGVEPIAVGLRWQSVIVSPDRLAWMTPPVVPDDAKFAWWNRLREVPCAWVSNRGESERFLYYDGPTTASAPVAARLEGSILSVATSFSGPVYRQPAPGTATAQSFEPSPHTTHDMQKHLGMFIRVDATTRLASGCIVEKEGDLDLSKQPMLHGDAVIQRFHTLLTEAGLTDAEAAGLVDSWRPQFFQSPGSRFIHLMSPMDYDLLCPIRIDPPPTELIRVGLVLSEFGASA
jgi:hypothetical protein